jgi:hypothetical protein
MQVTIFGPSDQGNSAVKIKSITQNYMTTISLKIDLLKKSVINFIFLFALISFTHCDAQSIVGKWSQVSGKMYCTPEAVQKSHGHLQAVMDMPKVEAVDEFKENKTLIETITNGSSKTSSTGSWSISGKTVTITIENHPPMSGIISDTGNTLIYTIEMPKTEHMQIIKREWTYAKI